MVSASEPHPIARRIHDNVLQLLGSALMKMEMCEHLQRLGRADEVPLQLTELRDTLDQTVLELRAIITELRDPEALKNRAA